METVTIPREEYAFLTKCRKIVAVVETAIHSEDNFSDLVGLSEKTASEFWDNKEDEIWNSL